MVFRVIYALAGEILYFLTLQPLFISLDTSDSLFKVIPHY